MNLRELREKKGKSRKELSRKLNITYTAYSNYEYGLRRISLEQVLILSDLFQVPAEEIIKAQLNSCQSSR